MNSTATRTTRIYETERGLSCNIPSDVLPAATKRVWEDVSYVEPGYYRTVPGWMYVSIYPHASTRLILTHIPGVPPAEVILSKGLDPTLPVQIRAYRSSAWLTAHPYHTTRLIDEQGVYDPTDTSIEKSVYGRATFPVYFPMKYRPEWSERRKELWKREKANWPELHDYIRSQTIYPFQVRGTTLPRRIKQGRWRTVREDFGIKYLDSVYPVTEYKDGSYRWDIPQHLDCYPVLEEALNIGNPEVQFYLHGFIYANFMFPGFEEALYRRIGRCYRSTSHIKIGVVDKRKYKFKFDIRSHYLSMCPQTYYVDPLGNPLPVSEALAWTNLRLLQAHPGFANIRAGFQTGAGLIRRKWDKNKQRMLKIQVEPRYESTLWVEGEISKEKPKDYMGTENVQISLGEGEEEYGEFYKFHYCTKEVEYYKPPAPPEKYDNDRIEGTMISLGARRIYTDINGFVWLR